MLPQAVPGPKLGFGPFQYDPSVRELWKHSSRLRLPSQPREVLEALLERPGELVTREDLRNRLWPGATAGDFEHGSMRRSINCGGAWGFRRPAALRRDDRRPSRLPVCRSGAVRFSKCAGPRNAGAAGAANRADRPPPGRWLRLAVAGALVMTAISGGIYWHTSGRNSRRSCSSVLRSSRGLCSGRRCQPAVNRAFSRRHETGLYGHGCERGVQPVRSGFRVARAAQGPRYGGRAHDVLVAGWTNPILYGQGKTRRADREGGAHALLAESPPFLLTGVWLGPERLFLNGASASYTVGLSGWRFERSREQLLVAPTVARWEAFAVPNAGEAGCDDGPARLRIVRSSDFAVVKDLFPSETRAQFVASTMNPAKGYLLYVVREYCWRCRSIFALGRYPETRCRLPAASISSRRARRTSRCPDAAYSRIRASSAGRIWRGWIAPGGRWEQLARTIQI